MGCPKGHPKVLCAACEKTVHPRARAVVQGRVKTRITGTKGLELEVSQGGTT